MKYILRPKVQFLGVKFCFCLFVDISRFEIWNSNVVNGGNVLQRKLKETIILNKDDLKWKETPEKCKWE